MDDTHEHLERAEQAEHTALSGDPFLTKVSVTIALLAVVAATVGSLESLETAATITEKNSAVFFQNKATDQWAFFQAKSLKKNMYDIAAIQAGTSGEEFRRQAKRNEDESREIQAQAIELTKHVDEKLRESDRHEHRHHVLTVATTLLHVSIAIATISIITRGHRWPWYGSIGLGIVGMIACASAYL
jgi:hypothetical protein